MPDEEEDLVAFARGELPPPGYTYGWLDTVADAVKAGKTFRRVRVVTRPLSFYTKWEFVWGYDWNVKAGEDIRILDVTDAPALSCPTMTSGCSTRPPWSSSCTGRTAPKSVASWSSTPT